MIAKDLHTVTTCLPTHSAIPANNTLALNVPHTTSTPVLESMNRYSALAIEECADINDTPLKGSPNGSPARAQAKVKPPTKDEDDHSIPPLKEQGSLLRENQDEEAIARPAIMKTAAGQEAASIQAVNRGHPVLMVEVPDEDDDTAYQIWLAKEQTLAIAKKEAMSDEPARSSTTTPCLTRGWCKPFEVDWTLRAICKAQNDNAARCTLSTEGRRNSLGATLRAPRTASLPAQEAEKTLVTKGLLDSGCTSSSINCTFVQKHGLDTKKMAVPIAVYNADGTRNKAGDITEFVEFRMTIGNHSEHIDFAITDLGSQDLYLGHDWLKRHNPVINWDMGTIIFGRCQCVRNPFPLPDVDPDNCWDEELEDGDTILAINMEEELVIWAVHHANDLAAAANAEKPKKTFEEMVPPDYCSFHDLFSKENFDELPKCKLWDHAIKLIPNTKSTLDCKDYRKLNEMTIKNRYLLPLISELIDKLQGAKYFTKLDVCWGYNSVRIKEGDKEKAAFHMNRGLFEPTVMFFGLTNSPATFQWMMNDIFKDLISEGKVTIYLDDILIFTKDLDEHRHIAEKCEFEVLETEYLGVIISEGQVRMDPIKLAGIAEWPTPTKKKELQSFLGFTNFYRKFIKNYSKVVCALTQLTGNAEWVWGAAQNQAFQQLKKQMAEDVILTVPNRTRRFRVKADASNGAIGAVLSQEQEGRWRPVAFMSKALTATERNYEIYDKELLAIMLALSEWHHYLMGTLEDMEIWMDHQNLQYF
ncbi:uncharacterized protein ARMOST_11681 [Armillaria ostoyae]|uniref:Reverse transcriptase domain-containing protein n=1 Tax=Armillaria ostoyae TaxID=47428 RepID=A0A284RHS8_ARMOS|nr:uncharacterized protein ARMOST_11681 [Armillaria ostoyae]